MNINRKLIILFILIAHIFGTNIKADNHENLEDTNDIVENNATETNNKEEINLDDEELPAVDPFQSSSGVVGQSDQGSQQQNNNLGMLSGLRLVGVISGKSRKIAVLSSQDGLAFNYEEQDNINENITLEEIFIDRLLIKDSDDKFYEVFMNNIIKPKDG